MARLFDKSDFTKNVAFDTLRPAWLLHAGLTIFVIAYFVGYTQISISLSG